MRKQVYISADYSETDGDKDVVDELNKWGNDDYHRVDFVDMSQVASGSVSKEPDCRICDLKAEFNSQINASSAVIFVVGNMTRYRTAGQSCGRLGKTTQWEAYCTPYKQNTNGTKLQHSNIGVRPHKEKINISKEIINKTRGAEAPYAARMNHTPLRGEQ